MLSIGITGSYASGKSYLLNLLHKEGYKIFSCDKCVGDLYKQQSIRDQILELAPRLEVFDIKKLAQEFYDDDNIRKKIEDLIHPQVLASILNFQKNNILEKFIFTEVPLLFEAGWEHYFDYVITTFCAEERRLTQARLKINFDEKIYQKLEKIQMSQSEKMKRADFVINTDVKMLELKSQILNLLEKLQ